MTNIKKSKIIYFTTAILVFMSLCIIPTIGLILDINKYQCEGCSFFYNLLVSIIGILLWSVFYGVFHSMLFAKDIRKEKLTVKNSYSKYLQHSIRNGKIQTISMIVVMAIVCCLILRFFIFQLMGLFS